MTPGPQKGLLQNRLEKNNPCCLSGQMSGKISGAFNLIHIEAEQQFVRESFVISVIAPSLFALLTLSLQPERGVFEA